jgi:hypothetical protein
MWSSPSKSQITKEVLDFCLPMHIWAQGGALQTALQTKANGVERFLLHVGVLGPKELSKLLIMDWPGFERSEEVASHH